MAVETPPATQVQAPLASQPLNADAVIRLDLLDGFELTTGNQFVLLPFSAQRLLAFLALQERPLLRVYVAGMLWPDTPEKRSTANLRSALWRLHLSGCRLVEATGQHLRLAASVRVDFKELTGIARRLMDRSIDYRDLLCANLYLCGELLVDWYDEWVVMERERFRQLRLHALELLCEDLTLAGRFAEAVEAGLAAIAGEPLRETAHRVLIRAYLAEGNTSEALRLYSRYRTLLWDEVGLKPTQVLNNLVHSLKT